ncbi:OsmC-related (seleno)protein [Pararhodobacter marinus]|uniref:OsmC-related (seleno)protein n=1 Tax=Pararhodobacter marinus TaxID=2184063 RepID=UPI0035145F66
MRGDPRLMDGAVIQYDATGTAQGKMRNDLVVSMSRPFAEGPWEMATDEGAFHGGDASAPPPLALFVGGLTGCIMTQIRSFASRMALTLSDLRVETRVQWSWVAVGRGYESAPKSFEIDVLIDSPHTKAEIETLVTQARRGCFISQTLGRGNEIRYRRKTSEGWVDV